MEQPDTASALAAIGTLGEIVGNYDAILCDVWGVVHDGVVKSPEAEAALIAARGKGLEVVLVTNSPRLSAGVQAQLDALAVSRQAYDRIVTSGDATRVLIQQGPRRLFHIGPARDADIFEGLDIELVGEEEAQAVVATGLTDDESETPEDYAGLLARMAARGLPFVCANPDIVVHRGERLVYCAGALGRGYGEAGGTVRLAGKPHRPIYEVALAGLKHPNPRLLCIGDGLFTDVAGAAAIGADALFVREGIHRDELRAADGDVAALAAELAGRGVAARYVIPQLV
ncbi:TIGR01459 family HAD-type hydrolase [Aureimonas populi]|nr:TIGR01459 family HAD-type hydrolase [Aureimonas populi]